MSNLQTARTVLDRHACTTDASKLTKQLDALASLVDHGAGLMVLAHASTMKRREDVVLVSVLFRQALVMLDAIELLMRAGAGNAARVNLRTFLEMQVCFHWVLAKDTRERATCLYVSDILQRRAETSLFDHLSQEFAELAAQMRQQGLHWQVTPAKSDEARQRILSIDNMLKGDAEYASARQAIEFDAKGKKRKWDANWTQASAGKGIGGMFEDVGQSLEYKQFYASLCRDTHGSNFKDAVSVEVSEVETQHLRVLDKAKPTLVLIARLAEHLFEKMTVRYAPGEADRLRKDRAPLISAMRSAPSVNYSAAPSGR